MTRASVTIPGSADTRRPWGRIDPDRFYGSIAVVVGLSQFPLAFAFAPDRTAPAFVVASGGAVLLAIGTNLFRGRAPFESGWSEDGAPGIVSAAVVCLTTVAVVAASIASVIP
jgi:hypothetical protein